MSTLRMNQETIDRDFDILECPFVVKPVPPWFADPRKESSELPRVFILDPGSALAAGAVLPVAHPYEPLDGHRVENCVWPLLSAVYGDDRVTYWRSTGGAEPDFTAETDTGPVPIQVKLRRSALRSSSRCI